MLKQYKFSFYLPDPGAVRSEVAVKLHGMLMNVIPPADAERMHERKYHPFSICCTPAEDGHTMLARVSSLHESGDAVVEGAHALRSRSHQVRALKEHLTISRRLSSRAAVFSSLRLRASRAEAVRWVSPM